MKKIITLICFSLFALASIYSQELRVVNQSTLGVINNLGNYYKFSVISPSGIKQSFHLAPGESQTVDFNFSKRNIKRYYVLVSYDVVSYNNDLKTIKNEFESREKARQNSIIFEGILRAVDQYFNDGNFFGFVDKSKLLIDLVNGKNLDAWAEDVATNVVEDAVIDKLDKKEAKSAAAAAFKLKELFQEQRYADLDRRTNESLSRLAGGITYKKNIDQEISYFNSYKLLAEVGISVKNNYTFLKSQSPSQFDLKEGYYSYSIRLINYWNSRNRKGNSYFPVGFSQSPIFYKNIQPDSVYPFGTAIRFTHLDILYGYNYRIFGKNANLSLFFEGGVRGNLISKYKYQTDTQGGISNVELQENGLVYGDNLALNINPMLSLGLNLDLNYINFSIRGVSTVSVHNTDKDTYSNLSASSFHVGIGLPLIKKNKFYH